jgi:hypothetical protein
MKCAFTLSDGTTQLYAEKELFDHSASKAIYHVKVTSISSSAGTDIYYYYNNSIADNTTYIGVANYKVYPTEHSDTTVKSTTKYSTSFWAYFATDPAKPLIGAGSGNTWASDSSTATNQRFHIDLGSAKTIKSIYYENYHSSGGSTGVGVQNFTFWGSNTGAGSFDDLVYANDGGWTQLTISQSTFDQHTGSDIADPKYITVTNTTAYRYYAFKFADNYGSAFMGVRRIVLGINPSHNVWDGNFKGVYHLNSASNAQLIDSTSNNKYSTVNILDTVAGKVSLGMDNDGAEYANLNNVAAIGAESFMLEVCFKTSNADASARRIATNYRAGAFFAFYLDSTHHMVIYTRDADLAAIAQTTAGTVNDGSWHYACVRRDDTGNVQKAYLDETEYDSDADNRTGSFTPASNTTTLLSGYDGGNYTLHLTGQIDEFRVSVATARSAAWSKATYNSLWDTLLTYGSEETPSAEEDNAVFFGTAF